VNWNHLFFTVYHSFIKLPLFQRKEFEYKTTTIIYSLQNCKNMLIEFSRDYLAGEGDITRHLGYLGYQIKHTQTAMDEFDYAVTNLATDLKDGIRLAYVHV